MTLTTGGHTAFLHDFEQRGLRFRGGAVDFIDEQQVLKHGAFFIAQGAVAFFIFANNVRAENVRWHQIGRALHSTRLKTHDL